MYILETGKQLADTTKFYFQQKEKKQIPFFERKKKKLCNNNGGIDFPQFLTFIFNCNTPREKAKKRNLSKKVFFNKKGGL